MSEARVPVPRWSKIALLVGALLLLGVLAASLGSGSKDSTRPTITITGLSSTANTRACRHDRTDTLLADFVARYRAGDIDRVLELMPNGPGFGFVSTALGYASTFAEARNELQRLADAGVTIGDYTIQRPAPSSVDIDGVVIRYGQAGTIKLQVDCALGLIVGLAWDVL